MPESTHKEYMRFFSNKNFIAVLVTFSLWLIYCSHGLLSAIDVWSSSETFKHCYFVLPGAAYIIWQQRAELLQSVPKTNYLALPFILLATFVYILGYVGGIQLFEHVAAFSLLPLLIWFCIGHQAAQKIWFPLLFVLFCIPIGEELVPLLQRITADMSVFALKLTDVPVFRNGLYIEIPEGRFVVAEACSGIRFFVGTIVFGALYAHLSFPRVWQQGLFLMLAIIVPIIANALRVYGTIMIGHHVSMERASGTDHLVYGWIFFLIVIFLLIAIGEIWRSKITHPEKEALPDSSENAWTNSSVYKPLAFASLLLAGGTIWQYAASTPASPTTNTFAYSTVEANVQEFSSKPSWKPIFPTAEESVFGEYPVTFPPLSIFSAWYTETTDGAELISYTNRFYDPDRWSLKGTKVIAFDDQTQAKILDITNPAGANRLILYWYQVNTFKSGNETKVKLYQAMNKLFGRPTAGAVVVFSISYSDNAVLAEKDIIEMAKDKLVF